VLVFAFDRGFDLMFFIKNVFFCRKALGYRKVFVTLKPEQNNKL